MKEARIVRPSSLETKMKEPENTAESSGENFALDFNALMLVLVFLAATWFGWQAPI